MVRPVQSPKTGDEVFAYIRKGFLTFLLVDPDRQIAIETDSIIEFHITEGTV
jgi:hypothetical protein